MQGFLFFRPPAHKKRAEKRRLTPDFGPLFVPGRDTSFFLRLKISTGVARLGFFLGQEAGLAGGLGFLDIVRHGEVIGHQLLV